MQCAGMHRIEPPLSSRSFEAIAYGKCVAINAQEMQKDMCANEFKAFKDCVQAVVSSIQQEYNV